MVHLTLGLGVTANFCICHIVALRFEGAGNDGVPTRSKAGRADYCRPGRAINRCEVMTETESETPPVGQGRKPRAWWQWLFGIGLLGGAAVLGITRVLMTKYPDMFSTGLSADPIPIRMPKDMKAAKAIPNKPGSLSDANVLIVTLDTTRADHIGCYGNDGIATPTMDRLAKEGVLFSRAISPAPTTLPSHCSIHTGLYPFHHGARSNGVFRLPESNTTLAEIFHEKGYATGAAISAFVLDSRFGLAQGFVSYNDALKDFAVNRIHPDPERFADKTTDVALDWLRTHKGEKFFYWIHYFDPHQPYEPPGKYKEEYAGRPYDGEIAYVDAEFKRVVTYLEETGQRDNTIIVIIGDHGQGMGQHDELTHGFLLYDTTLHVPLIMNCGSKLGGGVYVEREVSSVDVAPTVLSLLGLPRPAECDGLDLTQTPATEKRILYFDTLEGYCQYGFSPLTGVMEGAVKYIYGPRPELYDLSTDTHELDDLAAQKPDIAKRMEGLLKAQHGEDLVSALRVQPTEQLGADDIEMLRSLGYAVGNESPAASDASLPDPREMMPVVREAELAMSRADGEDVEDSIKRLREVAEQYPEFYIAHRWLADSYLEAKDWENAKLIFKRCIEIHADVPYPLAALGRLAYREKQLEASIEYFHRAIEKCPDYFPALSNLGEIYLKHNQPLKARKLLERACVVRPTDERVIELYTSAMKRSELDDEAIEFLSKRLEQDPLQATVRNSLGGLLINKGKCDETVAMMREGVKIDPNNRDFINNLAYALTRCANNVPILMMEASVMMEKLCQETEYKDPLYMRTLALIYAAMRRSPEAVAMAERALDLARAQQIPALVQTLEVELNAYKESVRKGQDFKSPAATTQPAVTQPADLRG